MSKLRSWLALQAGNEQGRTSLEDVLLFGHFPRYLWYRLRYFAAAQGGVAVLHAIELTLFFIYGIFSDLAIAFLASFGANVIASAWWGGLEVMRARVRRKSHDGRFASIGPWVGRWLRLAGTLSAILMLLTVVFVLARGHDGRIGPVDAYVVVRLLGLSAELLVRTFHDGAFALRRVYRPLWSLLAPGIAQLAVLAGAWSFIGLWSVPLAGLAQIILSTLFSVCFIARVYRDLEIRPRLRTRALCGFEAPELARQIRAFAAPALANATSRIGHLACVYVFIAMELGAAGPADPAVYLLFCVPFLAASAAWAKLFYFDLVKLHGELLGGFRQRLEHSVFAWSWVVGLMAWTGTLAHATGLLQVGSPPGVVLITALLFAIRARLASAQMTTFSAGCYGALITVNLALLLALSLINALQKDLIAAMIAACVSMLLAAVVLRGQSTTSSKDPSVLPLCSALRLSRSGAGTQTWNLSELSQDARGGAFRLAQRLARRNGWVGFSGDGLIFWHGQHGGIGLLAGREARRLTGIREVSECLTRRGMHAATQRSAEQDTLAAIARVFAARFPDGQMVTPEVPALAAFRAGMGWTERRAILGEAIRHLYRLSPRRQLSVDVSAFVKDRRISAVFLIPKAVPRYRRRQWKKWLWEIPVRDALS